MRRFVLFFPLWLLVCAALGLFQPALFTWFLAAHLVTPGLALIMLGMGLTLRPEDFVRVARRPGPVLWGLVLQYAVMPLSGFLMARTFGLPMPFAAGLLLVCSCPGGTASNVVAFLAGADVPLSVSMTAVSTAVSPLLTPLLATWLIGDRVDVEPFGLVLDTAQVVILPIAVGLTLRRLFPVWSQRAAKVSPAASCVAIIAIVSAVLAANKAAVIDAGPSLLAGVAAAHALGFAFGYALGKLTRSEQCARTLAIEVGMQNSGLAVILARGNFADPLVAVPGAISAVFHSVLGSLLAGIWARFPARPRE